MTKLPINFLLFVAILALLGGSGWNFYKAVTDKAGIDQKTNREEFEAVIKRGVAAAGVQASPGGNKSLQSSPRAARTSSAPQPAKQ